MIVDAQVHLWVSGQPNWKHHRQVNRFTYQDLLAQMDAAGVDKAVLQPPAWSKPTNQYAYEAVSAHPERFGMTFRFAPEEHQQSGTPLWLAAAGDKQKQVLGIFVDFTTPEQRLRLVSGELDWVWAAAQTAGVAASFWAAGSLLGVDRVAERYPGMKITVSHLGAHGGSGAKDDNAFEHMSLLEKLARRPNVAVKATGLPIFSSAGYPFKPIEHQIRRAFDAFGPARMFWGTDLSKMTCSYRQCVTHFTEELPWLSGRDLELVMGQAIRDWNEWT